MTNWYDYVQQNASRLEWPYPVRYDKQNNVAADVLIIGGGVAGCHAAINAAKRGAKVAVIDKGPVRRSGCSGAGVDHWHAACTNPCSTVTPEALLAEYEKDNSDFYGELGSGIAAYITAKEGYNALLDVEKMGVPVRDWKDEFVDAEFRDDKTKYMFAYDYQGRHIIRISGGGNIKPAMAKEVKRLGVEIYDFVMATSLLTEGGKQGGRVIGATGLNLRTGEFYIFTAKATVLTTGGSGQLYTFSTELKGVGGDPNSAGDGIAMAWRAGAECTMRDGGGGGGSPGGFGYFPHSAGNAHNSWYACNIVDDNGKQVPWIDRKTGKVLKTVSERYRLGPGEFFIFSGGPPGIKREPSLILDLPERIARGEYQLPLYADLPSMPPHERRAIYGLQVGNEGCTRYGIYDVFTKAGFDPDIDMPQAPVMPADQYIYIPWWWGMGVRHWKSASGGVVFDWDMKTNLPGLYVAGLQGGGGDHSTSATTGRYAGRKAADYARTVDTPVIEEKQITAEKARVYAPVQRNSGLGWKELKAGLCRVMQDYCGEYKSETTLKMGLEWLQSVSESEAASLYARNPHELARSLECLTHITLGEMVFNSALNRLGDKSPAINKAFTLENGNITSREQAFRWWLKAPYASTYAENFAKHSGL